MKFYYGKRKTQSDSITKEYYDFENIHQKNTDNNDIFSIVYVYN